MLRFASLFALMAIVVFSTPALAQQDQTFANIPWGSGVAQVDAALAEVGFEHVSTSEDTGDRSYKGRFLGLEARAVALMNPRGQLVKVGVFLVPDTNQSILQYRKIKPMLIAKYGRPKTELEHFSDPYWEGDGFEHQAIQVNKAIFVSIWRGATDESGLVLAIDNDLEISITYEPAVWNAESDRRSAKQNNAL